jgi:phosphonate transport system permease protein
MKDMQLERQAPPKSLVPAPLASVLSLVIPGLGQLLARRIRRGLLMIASLATILALIYWRINVIAYREITFADRLAKAFQRQTFFHVLIFACTFILWLWIVWDAYRQAKPKGKERRGGFGIFFLVIFILFALGWQISEINVVKAITDLPDTWQPLSKILWPWKAAGTDVVETLKAGAQIEVPCDESPLPPPEEVVGQPYLIATPTCGDLSRYGENNEQVLGTTLRLIGRGFVPDKETEIWWVDPLRNDFQVRQAGEYVSLMTDSEGKFTFDLIMPYSLIPSSSEGTQIHRVEARQFTVVGRVVSEALTEISSRMVETIFMGMMATVFGIILSIPVSFLAARNLMSGSPLTMAIYYIVRTIMNIVRSIEPLIWALIAVVWVGLGPFAGIIALTVHSVAALGKLYSESIENIDPGPIEAIQATGATRLQTIMYAVVPQMIPPFVSFSIYRWDINVRMSTIIGMVGGGGIGFILIQYIRLLDYRSAGIAVWFIAVTVAVLDYVSAEIRQRFV